MIIVEEIKMNLLAKSCFAPGLIAMISNLIASAGETDTDQYEMEWLKEYTEGMGHEIYRVKIEEEQARALIAVEEQNIKREEKKQEADVVVPAKAKADAQVKEAATSLRSSVLMDPPVELA